MKESNLLLKGILSHLVIMRDILELLKHLNYQ